MYGKYGLHVSGLMVSLLLTIIMSCIIPITYMEEQSLQEQFFQELNEDNWKVILEGEWMVQFYTSLFLHDSQKMEIIWRKFAKAATAELNVSIARIDLRNSPNLRAKFLITKIPCVKHVKNGVIRNYDGMQNEESLMLWLEYKLWYLIDPLPDWWHPDTIQMTMLSYIAQLPDRIDDILLYLQIKFGLSVWCAAGAFFFGTLAICLFTVLTIVSIFEYLFSSKKMICPVDGHLNSLNEELINDLNKQQNKYDIKVNDDRNMDVMQLPSD